MISGNTKSGLPQLTTVEAFLEMCPEGTIVKTLKRTPYSWLIEWREGDYTRAVMFYPGANFRKRARIKLAAEGFQFEFTE